MTLARRLLAHRRLAVLLCVAVLLMKLVVPAGFMLGDHHGRLTIQVCSGVAPAPAMTMAMPGHGKAHEGGKPDQPCAFAGLSAAALGSVDPLQLAALIAFVMALGLTLVVAPVPFRRVRLRPPLRGPPAFA